MSIYDKFKHVVFTLVLFSFYISAEPLSTELNLKYKKQFAEFDRSTYFQGGEASRFAWLHMPALFTHLPIHHHQVRLLGTQLDSKLAGWTAKVAGKQQSFDSYVQSDTRIDSLLVLHKGKIVYQHYKHHSPLERHIIWSVTKVLVATALAQLNESGRVDMQAPIKRYLPELKKSAWADVVLQDVVDMASGIDCRDSDGYENPNTCVYQLDQIFNVMPNEGASKRGLVEQLAAMSAHRRAGQQTAYNSANTLVIGLVIEAITNKPLHQALSDLIWQPMGAEADALMLTSQDGDSYASGGISARLADIARFGLLFTHSNNHAFMISQSYLESLVEQPRPLFSEPMQAGLKRLFPGDVPLHSRWQWDLIWQDGDMYKDGYSGQGLYVSPSRNLVMVWFGTADTQYRKHYLLPLARKLSRSALFNPSESGDNSDINMVDK